GAARVRDERTVGLDANADFRPAELDRVLAAAVNVDQVEKGVQEAERAGAAVVGVQPEVAVEPGGLHAEVGVADLVGEGAAVAEGEAVEVAAGEVDSVIGVALAGQRDLAAHTDAEHLDPGAPQRAAAVADGEVAGKVQVVDDDPGPLPGEDY